MALACSAAPAIAQQKPQRRWGVPGFDFRPDGAWRAKARRVAAERAQLLGRGDFSRLNASRAMGLSGTGAALSGVLSVPLVLFDYRDTNPSVVRDTSEYNAA